MHDLFGILGTVLFFAALVCVPLGFDLGVILFLVLSVVCFLFMWTFKGTNDHERLD